MKSIAIAVSVFNTDLHALKECLVSVCNQTYKNLEIIIIDDGSSNGAEKVCDMFAAEDSRIRVIHKANGGASSARNLALSCAQSDWITFVDSDDVLELNAIEMAESYCRNVDIVFFNAFFNFPHKETRVHFYQGTTRQITSEEKDELVLQMLFPGYCGSYKPEEGQVGGTWGKIYRVDFLKKNGLRYDESVRVFEDPLFNMQAFQLADGIVYLNECLYHYNIHPNSVTRNNDVDTVNKKLHSYHVTRNYLDEVEAPNNFYCALECRTLRSVLSDIKKTVRGGYCTYREYQKMFTEIRSEVPQPSTQNQFSIFERLTLFHLKHNMYRSLWCETLPFRLRKKM